MQLAPSSAGAVARSASRRGQGHTLRAAQQRIALGLVLCVAALATLAAPSLSADVLLLKNGGRVEGEVLNPDESPRKDYLVKLASGGQIRLAADQVREHIADTLARKKYRLHLTKMPPTARGHWILGEWCGENGLPDERQFHLQEAIRLEPDHEEARRALGFSRLGDAWVTQEDYMRQRGYVQHEGRWRLPQEVELEVARAQQGQARIEWSQKLKRWRGWLEKPRRAEEAQASIRAIDDPLAAESLTEALAGEPHLPVQQLYVSVLAKLDHPTATRTLIEVVLSSPQDELRWQALDALAVRGREMAVEAFLQALSSTNNLTIRRAAVGLSRLPDPRAVRPLIENLVTQHRMQVAPEQPGAIGASFGSALNGTGAGTGGLSLGAGGRPKTIIKAVKNAEVLDALLAHADGVNFGYDQPLWRAWYVRQQTPLGLDLRRAP